MVIQVYGGMETLITNGAKEELYGQWSTVRKQYLIARRQMEPYSPWQNKAESEIQEAKSHFHWIMNKEKVPEALWDFGLEYMAHIHSFTT